ncbi:FG-GAP-like repeat-containing protein [Streptomyces sp. NPDC005408]|uniref:FG-GAP-like repeat-containing protein n=1 Tax=Streptomyces sp. NPDC005408 TaxID=3155341 RepID=UPI0033A4332E
MTTGLGPLAASSAVAADDPSGEVVLPAPARFQPVADKVLEVGATGYLHEQEGTTGTLWTDYAAGETKPLTATGSGYAGMRAALDAEIPGAPRTVSITELGSASVRKIEVPEGAGWTKAFTADSVLVDRASAADGELTSLSIVRMEGGQAVERPITGLPKGVKLTDAAAYHRTSTGAVVLLTTLDGRVEKEYLVDYGSAELRELPDYREVDVTQFGDKHLLDRYSDAGRQVRTVPRADPLATPTVTQLPPPPAGYRDYNWETLLGDWIVFGWSRETTGIPSLPGVKLQAIPVGGGEVRDLLPYESQAPAIAADGSLLVTGGSSSVDWAVRRITVGPDGAPRITKVKDVPPTSTTVDGLSLGAGTLHYVATSDAAAWPAMYEHSLALHGAPAAGERSLKSTLYGPVGPVVSLGNGNSAYMKDGYVVAGGDRSQIYGRLTGGTGRYVVSDADADPDTSQKGNQYVGDLKSLDTRRFDGQDSAAVWGTTVWLSDPTVPSALSWYDMKTHKTSSALAIGSGCAPNELQAVGRWIYWSCAKEAKAGVWDQQTRLSTPVPFGPAQLGDGFLVRKDQAAGELTLSDFHTGDPAAVKTTEFATVPVNSQWTVDKFGGHVVYTDAQQRIHVKSVTVPRSPIGVIENRTDGTVLNLARPNGKDNIWDSTWQLSRPAATWSVAFKDPAGRTVRTITSTDRKGAEISATWNGMGDDGKPLPAAHYTWTLSADPGDGSGREVQSGIVQLADVSLPLRDYNGNGAGELFTVAGGTLGAEENFTGGSAGASRTTSTGWSDINHVVPFGDLDADGCNDVVVRTTTGDLYRYSAKCKGVVSTTSPKAKIGAGFNTFDTVLNSGDMTGDGRADLLARQRSTGDLYLYADNGAGGIKAGVKIPGKWDGLRLIGAGDLNGDGRGDLLTLGTDGTLSRHSATGYGTFTAPVVVFTNWGAGRDVIVGIGDITGDGKNDLVSRDANGKLLRNSGDGKGSFGSTVQIGMGWQNYSALY